jgi:HSP20 family protein
MSAKKDQDIQQRQPVDLPETHYHIVMGAQQFMVLRHTHVWRPPTDVMEDENRLIVMVEVAGMQHGEFHVAVSHQQLVVSGIRNAAEQARIAYHQLEVRYGEFRSEVVLPWPVDEDSIEAHYEDGFLRVVLPRAQAHEVRVIEVNKHGE